MHAVITGIGAISPYGSGRACLWNGVRCGTNALRPVTHFDASPYRNTLGGEVPDLDLREHPRATALALFAVREAIADAEMNCSSTRVGIILGTNFSGMESAEAVFTDARNSLSGFSSGEILRTIRAETNCQGPHAILSLSCASGTAAIGTALEWICAGRADIVLAGGFDELSETSFAGLSALRAISKDTVRPFDSLRGGTIFAEGAAVLVVESAAHAQARKAPKQYARLLGHGINNDAFHMTAPEKTGKGIMAVMRMALADAKISREKIVHLNAHGTGTKYNDLIETTAIKGVFGEHASRLVITANKSIFGHAMGAAGALEAAVTCLSIQHGLIPPTINCREQDPELDLDYCLYEAREIPIPYAMTNSYGLGGTNASLVLGHADAD